eukprot:3092580-Amphidinium_carterae.1
MRARANRTIKWFTCVECGSRWMREPYTPPVATETDVMSLGPSLGQTQRHALLADTEGLHRLGSTGVGAMRGYNAPGIESLCSLGDRTCRWSKKGGADTTKVVATHYGPSGSNSEESE